MLSIVGWSHYTIPPQNLKSNHSTCIKKTCSQMLDEVTTDKNIFVFE